MVIGYIFFLDRAEVEAIRTFLRDSCEHLMSKIQQLKQKHIKEILDLKAKKDAAKKRKASNK